MLKCLGGEPDAQQPDLKNAGFDKEIIGMGIEDLHQLIESEMSAQ